MTERKILKRNLKVKPSTPNDIIYVELNRSNIISKIKQRQRKFYRHSKELKQKEATLSKILG